MEVDEKLEKIKKKCQEQIDRAKNCTPSESETLIYGDKSQYIKGGIEALTGVIALIDSMLNE